MAIATAYNQVDTNKRRTWLIMIIFSAFVLLVAYILTAALGYQGPDALGFVGIFLIVVGVMNFASYYWSDSIILAISRATLVDEKNNKELYRIVENLCIASGLPVPKIYLIDDSAPNAFATGRDPQHASICFTTGILQKLDKLELEGVAAHELSHVKNFDTRLMAVVVILVGLVALLADMFFRITWLGGRRSNERGNAGAIIFVIGIIFAILSPLIARLIQLAVSRRREFLADSSGALLTRYPEGLAKALVKISADPDPLEVANKGTAHLYIVNPFKAGHEGGTSWFAGLFNTHPPIEERVKALRAMETG